MVPQTETKSSAGFKAGVKDYRLTYYTPDYVVKKIDSSCIIPSSIFPPGSNLPTDKIPPGLNRWGEVIAMDVSFVEVKKLPNVNGSIIIRNFLKRPKFSNQVRSSFKILPIIKRDVKVKAFAELSSSAEGQPLKLAGTEGKINLQKVQNSNLPGKEMQLLKSKNLSPVCQCSSPECFFGKYVNMSRLSRNHFLQQEYKSKLYSNKPQTKLNNLAWACRIKKMRDTSDYIEKSKIICLEEYFKANPVKLTLQNYAPYIPTLPPSREVFESFLTSSPFERPVFFSAPLDLCDYTPFIAIIFNPINGLRVAVESQGISRYQEGHPQVMGSGNYYILHGAEKLTIKQYIKSIANTLPRLKEDFNTNPMDLECHILKIGPLWFSDLKRTQYVNFYNKKKGLLSYSYNIEKETQFDIDQARIKCLAKGYSVVSLVVPVKIGSYTLAGSSFPGKVFPSIIQASLQTGVCLHKIVYRVFSKDTRYEDWCLISNIDQINKDVGEPFQKTNRRYFFRTVLI